MAQQQKSSISTNVLKGINWVKILIYMIIFYVVYSVIVSIIRFISPIFKTLGDFFGIGDGSKPGISGAPWWAWFGMAWYLLPAGALGILGTKGSELLKKFQYHNPDMTLAEIAKLTNYTEEGLKAERAKPEYKDLTEAEFSARMFRDNATKNLVEHTNAKAAAARAAADAAQKAGDAATESEKRQEEADAKSEAKDLEETGNAEANKIEGIK
jgi:hypothetical protein